MPRFVLRGVKGMRLTAQLEKIPNSHQKKRATAPICSSASPRVEDKASSEETVVGAYDREQAFSSERGPSGSARGWLTLQIAN